MTDADRVVTLTTELARTQARLASERTRVSEVTRELAATEAMFAQERGRLAQLESADYAGMFQRANEANRNLQRVIKEQNEKMEAMRNEISRLQAVINTYQAWENPLIKEKGPFEY